MRDIEIIGGHYFTTDPNDTNYSEEWSYVLIIHNRACRTITTFYESRNNRTLNVEHTVNY